MLLTYLNRVRFIVFVIALTTFFAGCKNKEKAGISAQSDMASTTQIAREKTLFIGGFQWGAPSSFNPLAISPAWPITGNMNLIYESMFGYDLLDGKLKGILGKSITVTSTSIEIVLNENARWQNGDSLTSADVLYTFNLHKTYSTNFSSLWRYVKNIQAEGPYKVILNLNQKEYNPLVVQNVVASVPVLPKKIFSKIEDIALKQVSDESGVAPGNEDILTKIRELRNDKDIIGSGPYTLHSYTDKEIVLKRVSNYWGNLLYGGSEAAPEYLVHVMYSDNDMYNKALETGDLDISQTFFPKIWEKFSAGVGTWYPKEPYYIPGCIPALIMGVSKAPFNDAAFRKAVAHSINYEKIKTTAVFGYTPELKPGLILPFGAEKNYYSEEDVTAFGNLYNPENARKILEKAKYTWGADGLLIDPSGKKIRTLFVTCPAGWTDWEQTIQIAVEGMRVIGIDVVQKSLDYGTWDSNLKNGWFDFTMKTPQPEQNVALPWSRFEQVLSSRDIKSIGDVMYNNEGRFSNVLADELLAMIPKTSDEKELKVLYRKLNQIFMNEMPIIPLMYRPWLFYQFNTKYWKNFPTEKSPYAAPQCLMVGAGVQALWGIRPSGK
jgi:peptide/nickel transport system substrate-binding protein